MVLPPVIGGVALLTAFSRRSLIGGWLHDAFGIQLTYTTAGAVLAASFVAMPFYVITVESGFRALDSRLEQAAAELGAGPVRVLTQVTLPLIAPSLAAGLVLAWARALGEFGATITFAGNVTGRTRTLPLSVFLLLDSDPDTATALCLILVLVSLAVIIALRHQWIPRR
jgi:molybdate transport system permease protein